jgi:hypothetical protein
MINYYRDMWKRQSHYSAPLTNLISKNAKFVWGAEQQQAFDKIKKIISCETLLAFPDFNKEFHIYLYGRQQLPARHSHNARQQATGIL